MAVGLQIKVGADVTGLMGAFQAAAGGAGNLTESLKATVASMSPVGAAGVAVADALIDMTTAAAEDRAEQEKLLAVYNTATGVMGDYNGEIDAAIKKGAEKAFSDSEVRAGLESLIVATGSADDANEELATAMDLARFAGVPLEKAADALAKAHQGQTGALAKLVPGLDTTAKKTDIIAQATELARGQADLYAESSEGMGKRSSDAFSEISETIGSAFLPIMDEVVPALIPIIEELGTLIKELLPLLKPVIDAIVVALRIFIGVLRTLIGIIQDVVRFIGDMVQKVQDAANFIGSVDLNPFSLPGGGGGAYPAPTGRGRSGRSGGAAGGGGVTLNVYGGDPWRIEAAVRKGYRGWTQSAGPGVPTREF